MIFKKRILICLLVVFCGISLAFAQGNYTGAEESKKPNSPPESFCPKTKISDNAQCFGCHTKPSFKLKESLPDEGLELPYGLEIMDGKPYIKIHSIDSDMVQQIFNYLFDHPDYKHVVMEIFSPGGSLLDAWRIIGIMDQAKRREIAIETRCYGFAASAGFLIFVNGDIGNRLVNPMASFMWHELWSLSFLKLETPSKSEEEAKIMRSLQDTIHNWLVTRCTKGITKDELDSLVHHKDYWLNGYEMIEAGFAEGEPT